MATTQSIQDWLLAGPVYSQPIEESSSSASTATSPYTPPLGGFEPTLRPFALTLAPDLADRMLAHLPQLLQRYPIRDMSDLMKFLWEDVRSVASDIKVHREADLRNVWLPLFHLCAHLHLDMCLARQRQRYEVPSDEVNVFMDAVLRVEDEERVALELKRDAVYMAPHNDNEIDRLAGKDWLDWDGLSSITGLKSIIIKVGFCFHSIFYFTRSAFLLWTVCFVSLYFVEWLNLRTCSALSVDGLEERALGGNCHRTTIPGRSLATCFHR